MWKNINKGWRFTLNDRGDFTRPEYDESGWRDVNLPHDWQIENARDPEMENGRMQGFYPREQVGWYRCRFTARPDWRDRSVILWFDGVQRFSRVWINGVELGCRPYGYVPFGFEVSDKLIPGENVIAVRVDNTKGGGDRWYSGAGIYRDVSLIVQDKLSVTPYGLTVETAVGESGAEVRIGVELQNLHGQARRADMEAVITSPEGAEYPFALSADCPPGELTRCEAVVQIGSPALWDLENPALYELTVVLGGDSSRTTFGIRTALFRFEDGFTLNGRAIKLMGVDLHHDGGAVGAAVPVEIWKYRLEKLKALGCNAIRCSHNPQAAEFYDLADRMGFLVVDELYDKWSPSGLYYSEFFDEWWERDLEAMIRRDRNHPSVVLWSVGNEIEFQYDQRFYEVLSRMCEKARSLDPARPVSAALMPYCFGEYNDDAPVEKRISATLRYADIVDVLMLNYMESFYRALKKAGLGKPIIGSEVYTYYRSVENQFMQVDCRSPWLDVKANHFVAGGFLWAGVEYIGESMGWPSRGWTGTALDSAGFPKLRAGYLASWWKEEPVLTLAVYDEAERWDMAAGDWGFPQMRRHWNCRQPDKILHVAAMTNCDEVRLYLNDEAVRIAKPDFTMDGVAHFYVPARRGTIRCEGWKDGRPVVEDRLQTATQAAYVEIVCPREAATGAAIPAEIWLKDKFGQPWVLGSPKIKVRVEGAGELIALDNGDMLTTTETYASGERSFYDGHILAILRAGEAPGECKLTALAEGYVPVGIIIRIK